MSYYINNEMKIAAYKSLESSYGRKNEVFESYYLVIYRGHKPKNLNSDRFEHIEFTIQITSDSPLVESLEKLGVNTEYPIDITGFIRDGEDKVLEETNEYTLDINQAEIWTKDRAFENQYFECPSCNYPTTPRVKVTLNLQQVDNFNANKEVEVSSGSVSFKCGNRNCRCQGNPNYKDIILRRTIAGNSLRFLTKEQQKNEDRVGKAGETSYRVHMPPFMEFREVEEQLEGDPAAPVENIGGRLEEILEGARPEDIIVDDRPEDNREAPADGVGGMLGDRLRAFRRRNG